MVQVGRMKMTEIGGLRYILVQYERENESHLKKIKDKADGQLVKTFVSNNWTLEYDLFIFSLKNEKLKGIMIDSLIKASYVEKNQAKKKRN